MKLLLDQNISWKLVENLQEAFPGTGHVKNLLSTTASDRDIWEFARDNDFAIVTKDDDFEQRSVLEGHPPKVIWIRLGNCRSGDIEALLISSQTILEAFLEDPDKSLLPIP